MADTDPTGGLWNWAVAGRFAPDRIRDVLADVLRRPVARLGAGDGVLVDAYPVGGDFPTVVDVYLAPSAIAESTAASAVAARLGAAVLLPDDSLDPSRYVLVGPDGTVRRVHVDETETDDGPERRNPRPCTGSAEACPPSGCGPTPRRPAAA